MRLGRIAIQLKIIGAQRGQDRGQILAQDTILIQVGDRLERGFDLRSKPRRTF